MTDDDGDDDDVYGDESQVSPPPCHCQMTNNNPVFFCVFVYVKASLAGIDFCCDCDRVTYDPQWAASVGPGSGWVSDPLSFPRSENSAPPRWSPDCPRLSQRRS